MTTSRITTFCAAGLVAVASTLGGGCADLIRGVASIGSGGSSGPEYSEAEYAAAPLECYQSYRQPVTGVSPHANADVARWYASLTPAIVESFAVDATYDEFTQRAVEHAVAAGLSEDALLDGGHPDPVRACGAGWRNGANGARSYEATRNAGSAARSIAMRAAYQSCAADFEALTPKVAALATQTAAQLAAIPAAASPDAAWAVYHQAMAAHRTLLGRPTEPDRDEDRVFGTDGMAFAGTPYVVFTDMLTRFAGKPAAFLLRATRLAALPPDPELYVRSLEPMDEARDVYCLRQMAAKGSLYEPDVEEDGTFDLHDGRAWLAAHPAEAAAYTGRHFDAHELPSVVTDDIVNDDDEDLRLFQRPISKLALRGGAGTIEFSNTETREQAYECAEVLKVKHGRDGATARWVEECAKQRTIKTVDTFTLAVAALPPGLELKVGDSVLFFARRTKHDSRRDEMASKRGERITDTTTVAADLLHIARVWRGDRSIYPAVAATPAR